MKKTLKFTLSDMDYTKLFSILRGSLFKKEFFTDYFYDTSGLLFYEQYAQIVIRKSATSFMGYVVSHDQVANSFSLDKIPNILSVDGVAVSLKGSIATERSVFGLSHNVEFILDKDICLDEESFEFYVKYPIDQEQAVSGMIQLVRAILGKTLNPSSISKSDRLFKNILRK